MTARRLRLLLPVAGLIAAFVLAVTPQWYRSPGGFQGKAGLVESQVVGCGITLAPRNPHPPPGANDACDRQHVIRVAAIVIVVFLGLMLGAIAASVERLGRRRRNATR